MGSEERQSSIPSTSGRSVPNGNAAHHARTQTQKPNALPSKKLMLWTKMEAMLWVCAALFAICWGDGRHGFMSIVISDARVKRTWLHVGAAFLGIDFLTFLYLSIWVKRVKHQNKSEAKAAPSIITTETLSTTAAGITLSVALWGVWKLWTPVVLVVLFMGFTMASHLRPSQWAYKRKGS